MSGLIQKAKEVVHDVTHKNSSSHTTGTHGSTNAGPHNSNMANAADPRIDSDLDGSRNAGLNQTTHTTGHPTTMGTHTAGTTGIGSTTHGSTNAGPHNSNMANKLDPRVDSDMDRSRNMGMNQTTHTGHVGTTGAHTTGHTGTTGIGSTTHSTTHGSTNAGPHNSNLMNKLDPRVDSDMDGSKNMGMNQTTHTTGHATTGHHATAGTTGIGGTTHGSTNAGPYDSNVMNKMDPRIDSDLDGSRNMGMNQTTHTGGYTGATGTHGVGHTGTTGIGGTHGVGHTGTTGIGSTTHGSTNAGPHNSNMMNKMDPRVDSDLDGGRHAGLNQTTHNTGHSTMAGTTGHTTSTQTNTTAGPHKSNLLNKLDPRVDSDLDGSKNMGMNQTTHTTGHTTY